MLVRLVKLSLRPDKVDDFLVNFDAHQKKLLQFKGCEFIELLQYDDDKSVFFTHSHWQTRDDLENYRRSELFNSIWAKTKPMFRAKAEAWSTFKC